MEILQIVVLFIGAILFTVSFFIPDKQVSTKEIREREEKAVKEIIDEQLSQIRQKIDEATEESLERAKDSTERQMDRITNEKMMAINEYSDTVMTEIHKNHEEAVFLYDMLNNKHAQVKTTAAELNQAIKLSKMSQTSAKNKTAEKEIADKVSNVEEPKQQEKADKPAKKPRSSEAKNMAKKSEKPQDAAPIATVDTGGVEVMFASDNSESNSNNQILDLHKQGKSNMAIARELGLGIGEVKLVIDLFEGGV